MPPEDDDYSPLSFVSIYTHALVLKCATRRWPTKCRSLVVHSLCNVTSHPSRRKKRDVTRGSGQCATLPEPLSRNLPTTLQHSWLAGRGEGPTKGWMHSGALHGTRQPPPFPFLLPLPTPPPFPFFLRLSCTLRPKSPSPPGAPGSRGSSLPSPLPIPAPPQGPIPPRRPPAPRPPASTWWGRGRGVRPPSRRGLGGRGLQQARLGGLAVVAPGVLELAQAVARHQPPHDELR